MSEENGTEMCRACKTKPVWGYAGNGLYVGHLCKYCYKRSPNIPEESQGRRRTSPVPKHTLDERR